MNRKFNGIFRARMCKGSGIWWAGRVSAVLLVYSHCLQLVCAMGYSGNVTAVYPRQIKDNIPRTIEARFAAEVAGDSWKLRIEFTKQPPEELNLDYQELFFDGQDLYQVDSYKTYVQAGQQLRGGPLHTVRNDLPQSARVFSAEAMASVQVTEIPFDVYYELAVPIWLTLCSERYFEKSDSRWIEPFIVEPRQRRKQRVLIARDPETSSKIQRIVTFDGGTVGESTETDSVQTYMRYGSDGFPPPYDHGFTNAIFRVLSFTNVFGSTVPYESEFMKYLPKRGGKSSNELVLTVAFSVRLTNYSSLANTPTRPPLPQQSIVLDHRFVELGAITYELERGDWKSEEEVAATPEYARILAAHQQAVHRALKSENKMRIVFVVLLCTLILPLAFATFKKLKGRSA